MRSSTERCSWHGIVLTSTQRETVLRFWLDTDHDDLLPSAADIQGTFENYLSEIAPEYRESFRANFTHLAQGGVLEDGVVLACYAEYDIHEYVLGSGPPIMTVVYDNVAKSRSYDLYRRSHAAGRYGVEEMFREGNYRSTQAARLSTAEDFLGNMVGGRESVVMLAPMGAHNAIAVEAWQVVDQWDLQTDDQGMVQAVRYGTLEGDPEHTQTLTNLTSRITTAAAADDFADDRIANVSGLTQYYRDIGAYGDITPDDGSTTTFTPAQPPSVWTCANGTAVASPNVNRGLVYDCEALLAAKDALRGTATLNWSKDRAITSWDGITTSGTPSRVTEVDLSSESLSGTIPADLGTLFELTTLDLSSNSLTGSIPTELGWLFNLEELRLSGNSLTGCIPVALKDVATNDLASLNLLYCAPPAPGNLSAGTATQTSVSLSWDTISNASKYRMEYRLRSAGNWITDDDTLTGTSHTVDELEECRSAYQFRVSAYGSGTTYAAAWSEPSTILIAETSECTAPVFDEESYSFTVMEDAGTGTEVDTVSATDPNDDAVTYAVTAGNAAGTFAIGPSTGTIVVAGPLNRTTTPLHTLTVQADDGNGNTDSVTVEITVTQGATCSDGTAVPNPTSDPGLVSDCDALLRARDALRGTASLNWSARTAMTGWDGLRISGTPRRVTDIDLSRRGLTGSIPAALGDLSELSTLELSGNALTGEIPAELGGLSDLAFLRLTDNMLTGEIPVELGSLSNVSDLWLNGNRLSGSIPPEFGGLTRVTRLWLAGNSLTGTIPGELADLTSLTLLLLYGNSLTGCVPPGLRTIGLNDIAGLGLSDCENTLSVAPMGLRGSLASGTFSLGWTALTGAGSYEPQHRVSGSGADWAALPAVTGTSASFTPDGGVVCATTHEFRVRARGNGMTHVAGWTTESAPVSVDVGSCNAAPTFGQSTYAFTVPEDALVNDLIDTVSATDTDTGDTVMYAITAGNTDGKFDIDNATGEVFVTGGLDYEMMSSYTLTVEASDGNGGTGTATVNIEVGDVPEDPPPAPGGARASLANGVFSISWNAVSGASKYVAQHRIPAEQDLWTDLPSTTGTGTTYEPAGGVRCGTTYEFRVSALGDGVAYAEVFGPASAPPASVMTDACPLPPVFTAPAYDFTVPEDAAVSDLVGTVEATDPDTGEVLTYMITAGNGDGKFDIGNTSGMITVVGALDYEMTASYALTVQVDDGRGGTDTATVNIAVTDVAEDPPPAPVGLDVSLADGTFSITWDALTGAARYEAQHRTSGGNWTALPETTGTSAEFSPEGGPACSTTYQFQVRAYGDTTVYAAVWGVESGAFDVTTEACPRPPVFDAPSYVFSVAENTATDTTVGTVSASDPDTADTLGYSITAGNEAGKFLIGSGTGAITVAGALDHEETASYALTVQVDDGRGGTDTASVTVTVTDIAEDAPPAPGGLSVSLASGTFSISWNALAGAARYEAQHRTSGSGSDWAVLPETTSTSTDFAPADGPTCRFDVLVQPV